MAVTDRAARVVLALVAAALLGGAWVTRIPQFWGDGATFYSMAWSLAADGDLQYEARDVFRVRREFPSGPQGIFLKRASGGLDFAPEHGFPWFRRVPADDPRIYFAKAFAYPVVAAPFVRVLGTRGLLVVNALAFTLALVLAYLDLRRRTSPGRALAVAVVLLGATVAPIYVLWPAPEMVTFALLAAGLFAWRCGWPLAAAVLFGIATYAKPYNLFVALPLGAAPFLEHGRSWWRGFPESLRRGAVLAGTVIALFGLNKAITGEFNYQGGERKTFYGTFPFERDARGRDVTFGNSGFWMTTDHLGALQEGADEDKVSRRTGPLRAPEELRRSFWRNLGYFWVGRFGGALPYYAPAILALGLFLAVGPRTRDGWLGVAALAVSWIFYIEMIPDNWYGGGGTVGNRYFLNLLPLAVLFVPRGREWLLSAAGLAVSVVFLAPVWMAPLYHSLHPGAHAARAPFRVLPPELSMLNDLSVFTELWRKKRSYGDTEGDAHRHWPADPKAYYLYFPDDGTFGPEPHRGVEGFWLRAGAPAEVIVRALEPVREMRVEVTGGPDGDEVTVRAGARSETIAVGAGETRAASFVPGPGFPYYDTFVNVVRLRSRRGAARPEDPGGRPVGAFVSIALETDRRPRK